MLRNLIRRPPQTTSHPPGPSVASNVGQYGTSVLPSLGMGTSAADAGSATQQIALDPSGMSGLFTGFDGVSSNGMFNGSNSMMIQDMEFGQMDWSYVLQEYGVTPSFEAGIYP